MRNKKLFFGILLLLVSLILAAGFFYNKLKDKGESTALIIYDRSEITSPSVPEVTEKSDPVHQPVDQEPAQKSDEEPTAADEPQTNMSIPDFTVYDKDGNEVKLSDFIGKPIVLNFFASWCAPCKAEMPDFEEKYRELGGEVEFIMVNLTDGYYETVESASSFIESQGYTFPVFYDTASSAAIAYNVTSIPTTLFIDRDGNIVAKATGAINADTLEQGIGMIS